MDFNHLFRLRKYVIDNGLKQNWWNHQLTSDDGLITLDYVFPRTKIYTSFNIALKIAQNFHDQQVGKDKFHLFRLSENVEESFHKFMFKEINNINYDESYFRNKVLNNSVFSEGPLIFKEENFEKLINKIEDCYIFAFKNNKNIYPYFFNF